MHFLVLELEDWKELYLLDPMEAGRFKGGKLTPENCQKSLGMRKGILMFFQSPTTWQELYIHEPVSYFSYMRQVLLSSVTDLKNWAPKDE